jgi:hypothetical protein
MRRGLPVQSFQGLLDHLGTLTRNTCTVPGTDQTFEQLAQLTEVQRRAFELIGANVPLRLLWTGKPPRSQYFPS